MLRISSTQSTAASSGSGSSSSSSHVSSAALATESLSSGPTSNSLPETVRNIVLDYVFMVKRPIVVEADAAACSAAANDTRHNVPNDTPVSLYMHRDPEETPNPDFNKRGIQCGRYAKGSGLSDAAVLAGAAHNLLWRKEVDETVKFLNENPEFLYKVVEIEDSYGQKIRGTILQIVAAAGDRSPRDETKADEKVCGLVKRLYFCFPSEQKSQYAKQLNGWFGPGSKEAMQIRMEPYVRAMETLCQELKDLEIPPGASFEELLKLPIAEKFRRALATPDFKVVTSGLIFDFQLFLQFFEIWERNVDDAKGTRLPPLGPYYGLKSDLFAAIVYQALLERAPQCDQEILKKSIVNIAKGGVSGDFKGFGDSFFWGVYKRSARAVPVRPPGGIEKLWEGQRQSQADLLPRFFKAYVKQKYQLWNYAIPAVVSSCHEPAAGPPSRNV